MKRLILTLVGKDEECMIEDVANAIANHNGNWTVSKLSHLGGYLAGILQIEIEDSDIPYLTAELAKITTLDIHVQEADETKEPAEQRIQLVISGNDRPGIVKELTTLVKTKGANLVHFESRKQNAVNWDIPLFHAVATIEVPDNVSRDEMVSALESLSPTVVVDIE